MKNYYATLLLLLCLSWSSLSFAQSAESPHGIAVRAIFHNYQYPLESVTSINANDFSGGLEFEYYRYLNNLLDLSFPLRINQAYLPLSANRGDAQQIGMLSLDGLLNLNFARQARLQARIFAGLSGQLEDMETFSIAIPLGLGLDVRLSENAFLSFTGGYRVGTDDFRDHLHLGAGLRIHLNPTEKQTEEPAEDDRDGDGVTDGSDLCPDQPGPSELMGCPDGDSDGVPDVHDKCPSVAGPAELGGCPDSDSDGITDAEDECPSEAGPSSNNGCPLVDADGDGVADADDKCPGQAGTLATMGCPDTDGDGVADQEDDCPEEAGSTATQGCPDTDNDGVANLFDKCPMVAGLISNQGCPEISETDRTTLTEAVSAVNFETGSNRLTSDSYTTLDKIVDIMNRYPGYKLRIGGHTDSVGSREPNRELSERRAKACYDYLVTKGVDANRMSYVGYGESQPIADNMYKEGREQNRRVEFDLYIE